MKQIFKNLSYTLLATSLLCACSSESDPVTATAETDPNAISFTSYVGDMTRQSSEIPAALRTLQHDGFKVFANRTATDWAMDGATSQSDFMYDQTVFYVDEVSAWGYSPSKVWPKTDKVSFFAYSPYDSQASTFMASPSNVPGATQLDYTHSGRIGSQDDLLAAASFNNTKTTHAGSVSFNFYHTLSQLRFAYSRESIAETTTVKVSKLELQYVDGAIKNTRRLDLSGVGASMTASIWSDTGSASHYTGDACQAGSVLNGESVLLIPQTYEDGQLELVVSYTLTTNDPALPNPIVDEVVDRVIALPAVQNGLQPNKQYLYTLEIKPNAIQISSDIQVGAWGDASSHVVEPRDMGIYYNPEDNAFHMTSGKGLAIFSDIVNRTNELEIEGYTGTPNSNFVSGVLDNDIDLSTVCGPEKGNWIPIGNYGANNEYNSDKMYRGTFDGQSHTIDNLYIDRAEHTVGLFGYISGATVRNLTIRNVNLNCSNTGNSYVGAISAIINQAELDNCHLVSSDTKSSSIHGDIYVGGLYGLVGGGTITNCTVRVGAAGMSISGSGERVGGLAGQMHQLTLKNCEVAVEDGTLTIEGNSKVGGAVGYFMFSTTVLNTTVDCGTGVINIIHDTDGGGLVGCDNGSTIVGSYSAITSLTTTGSKGAYMVGNTESNCNLYGCWAYCANAPVTDGLVGGTNTSYPHNSAYGTSQITDIDALNSDIIEYNKAVSEAFKTNFYNIQGTYGPEYDATQPAYEPPVDIYYEDGVFHMTTAEGLVVFGDIVNGNNLETVKGYTGIPNNMQGAKGELDNDIDLSTVCGPELGNWAPIGTYTGHFNGNNHYVENLYIEADKGFYKGLFGNASYGSIRNVKIRGAHITGADYIGALVGNSTNLEVTNCHLLTGGLYATTLSGNQFVGGLFGWSEGGTTTDCSVRANAPITIKDSPSRVSQYAFSGGFVGLAMSQTIKNCSVLVGTGGQLNITRVNSSGGFVGDSANGSIFLNCSVSSTDCAANPITIKATDSGAGGFVGMGKMTAVGCYSAVTTVEANSWSAFGAGRAVYSHFYGCWAYCKNAPATNAFEGSNLDSNFYSSTYGTSAITSMSALNTDITTYNGLVPEDKRANLYNSQGRYGPVHATYQ